jgi:hypothetical protein
MNTWVCLPINQTYQIGGLTKDYFQFLYVSVVCQTAQCFNSTNTSNFVTAYTMASDINAANSSSPF